MYGLLCPPCWSFEFWSFRPLREGATKALILVLGFLTRYSNPGGTGDWTFSMVTSDGHHYRLCSHANKVCVLFSYAETSSLPNMRLRQSMVASNSPRRLGYDYIISVNETPRPSLCLPIPVVIRGALTSASQRMRIPPHMSAVSAC